MLCMVGGIPVVQLRCKAFGTEMHGLLLRGMPSVVPRAHAVLLGTASEAGVAQHELRLKRGESARVEWPS